MPCECSRSCSTQTLGGPFPGRLRIQKRTLSVVSWRFSRFGRYLDPAAVSSRGSELLICKSSLCALVPAPDVTRGGSMSNANSVLALGRASFVEHDPQRWRFCLLVLLNWSINSESGIPVSLVADRDVIFSCPWFKSPGHIMGSVPTCPVR